MLHPRIKISLITIAVRKCFSRLRDLFHFLLYRGRLSENTIRLLRIQKLGNINNKSLNVRARAILPSNIFSRISSLREREREQRVMQNPQHLSMKPLRITAAYPSGVKFSIWLNHRTTIEQLRSTDLLKPSLTISEIDLPKFFFFPSHPEHYKFSRAAVSCQG